MPQNNKKLFSRVFVKQAIFALFGLAILIFISWPLYGNIRKRYLINIEIEKLKNDISAYETKNDQLGNLIKYLGSDQYIEEQARKNLGLIKEGENVVVLKNKNSEEPSKTTESLFAGTKIYDIGGTQNKGIQKTANPLKWISYFLNKNY